MAPQQAASDLLGSVGPVGSASKITTPEIQKGVQYAATQAVANVQAYAAKSPQLQTEMEKKFFSDKGNQAAIAKCLTQPEGAEELKKYLVSKGINFPERDRILTFYTTVIARVYTIEKKFHGDVQASSGDAILIAKAIKDYENAINELNLRYGQAAISQSELQRRAADVLRLHGMKGSNAVSLAGSAQALERQAGQNFLIALNYDAYELAENIAKRAQDERTKPKEGEPMAARAEKPETEKSKLTEDQIAALIKDVNDFITKNVGALPAAVFVAEAPVVQPRMEKAKAPDKEVATPPTFGGGAAIKVPKAGKAKTEAVVKPTESQARTANQSILRYETQGYAVTPRIIVGKFESEKKKALETGRTDSLKDYMKLMLDTVVAATAKAAESKKQTKN